MTRLLLSQCGFLVVMFCCIDSAHADKYHVKFDTWPRSGGPFLSIQLTNAWYHAPASTPPTTITWGSNFGLYPGYTNGSQIRNAATMPKRSIVSMHFKIKDVSKDEFLIDSKAGGSVFTKVYVKKSGDKIGEAIFTGANVSTGDSLWSEIWSDDTNSGTPDNPYSNFTGYWSDEEIAPPGTGWTQIAGKQLNNGPQLWLDLIASCPNRFRQIKVYDESDDGKSVVFISDSQLFLYSNSTKELRTLTVNGSLPQDINRISISGTGDAATAKLWANGIQVGGVELKQAAHGEVIGSVPRKVLVEAGK